MKTLIRLTLKSLWNRRVTLLLTVFSIAISVMLLLGVEYIRKEARENFVNTISGTDLIVGARSGPIQLMLYSVFHIGNATNNISWKSYKEIESNKWVDWTIPISLGDSHRGYRVLGTNKNYFKHFKYADKQPLAFGKGVEFNGVFDAVIGAEVAKKLNYDLGKKIILSHGAVSASFADHGDKPFTVVGVLEPTGTPVDRTVIIQLEGIEAIHIDWLNGAPVSGYTVSAEEALKKDLSPKLITAFLVGLKTRVATFRLQREINEYKREPLLAAMPGITLADLWRTIGNFEKILQVITGFVVLSGLFGLLTTLLSTLNERRREMAILRSVGAHPWQVFALFVLESLILVIFGCLVGMALLFGIITLAAPWVADKYGIYLSVWVPSFYELILMAAVAAIAVLFSFLPAWIAYKRSLQDGLTVRT